jgi:hypothetical protein
VKTSWLIFMLLVYFAIFYFAGVAEYNNLFTPALASSVKSLGTPTGTNWIVAGIMQISAVWEWVKTLIQMLFLWNGTLWTGGWLYFYYFVCLPLTIGIIGTLVFILRGVHSS